MTKLDAALALSILLRTDTFGSSSDFGFDAAKSDDAATVGTVAGADGWTVGLDAIVAGAGELPCTKVATILVSTNKENDHP